MSVRQQRWLGLGLAAITSGLLLLALGRVTVPPRTDRTAVMAVLDQRRIVYQDVAVRAGAGGVAQDGNAYVAAVDVAAAPPAYGTIVCESRPDACVVWTDARSIQQVALLAVAWPSRGSSTSDERCARRSDGCGPG